MKDVALSEITQKPIRHETMMAIALLHAAIFYNAFLAFINAHIVKISEGQVILTEGLILAVAIVFCVYKVQSVAKHQMFLVGLTFLIFAMLFFWISITNNTFFIKSLRDVVIIFVYYLLGTQCSLTQIVRAFRIIAFVILGVMALEGWFTDIYAWIFQPASYYAATRGVAELSVDSSGLFRNSLGFEGRFSFSLFGQRRLSSIFLEQVSLANFAMVLSIFTMTFWKEIRKADKLLFVVTILFMILSNSSRTGSAVCLLMLFGYFIFPLLPRFSFRLTMPLILLLVILCFYDPVARPNITSDDVQGRMVHTVYMLSAMDFHDLVFGNIKGTYSSWDSGYAYFIYSQTIFGLVCFWLFLAQIFPAKKDMERRFSQGTTLYIALNLLVGAAIFSIKVSAPLWFIAGYLSSQARQDLVLSDVHEQTS